MSCRQCRRPEVRILHQRAGNDGRQTHEVDAVVDRVVPGRLNDRRDGAVGNVRLIEVQRHGVERLEVQLVQAASVNWIRFQVFDLRISQNVAHL